MAIIRCNNGHYYDDKKFAQCPHCGVLPAMNGNTEQKPAKKTGHFSFFGIKKKAVPETSAYEEDDDKTIALEDDDKTIALEDDDKTIALEDDDRTIALEEDEDTAKAFASYAETVVPQAAVEVEEAPVHKEDAETDEAPVQFAAEVETEAPVHIAEAEAAEEPLQETLRDEEVAETEVAETVETAEPTEELPLQTEEVAETAEVEELVAAEAEEAEEAVAEEVVAEESELETVEKEPEEEPEATVNDYIVGWLVCTAGADKGRDYRLYQGFNRVVLRKGRLQLVLQARDEDEVAGAVVYDDNSNRFFLMPQQDDILLNGETITEAAEIQSGNEISVGEEKLVFVAFCTEERHWNAEEA